MFSDFYKKITAFNKMQASEKLILKEIQAPPPDDKQEVSGTIVDLSRRYMVWKDKKGNYGFSDIQYPDEPAVDSICVDGRWEKYSN